MLNCKNKRKEIKRSLKGAQIKITREKRKEKYQKKVLYG